MLSVEDAYRAHARTVYRYLLSLTRSEPLAEELTQETFYRAVKNAESFDGSCKVSTWLCAIAKNLLREEGRRPHAAPLDETVPAPGNVEEEALARAGQVEVLQRLHLLAPEMREVLHLRLLGGLSFREVGEVMGKTENWARVTYYRGKEKLKKSWKAMNETLSCEIVRDLLPLYADGLASEATARAVQAHVARCPGCAAALARMQAPEQEEPAPEAQVDYLKTLRRRTNRRGALVGAGLFLAGLALLAFRVFYVGTPARAGDLSLQVEVAGNALTLRGTPTGSGLGICRVSFSDSAGMVTCHVYTAPKTFFNQGEFTAEYETPVEVGRVTAGETVLWESGTEISPLAARLFAAKNPFVGDMPANGRVADALGVTGQFGRVLNELQTTTEPYGWTLEIVTPLNDGEEAAARAVMTADACAMLAVVENLGSVTWQYQTPDGAQEFTVTAEEATAIAGGDIKTFGESAAGLEALVGALGLKWVWPGAGQ